MRPATLLAAAMLTLGAAAAPQGVPLRAAETSAEPPAESPAEPPAEPVPQDRAALPPVPLPIRTNRLPPDEALWRGPVAIERDPPAFYAPTYYRERGLTRDAGGYDADARGWVASFRQFQPKALRPTHRRHTIDLVPMGEMSPRMEARMHRIREFLEVYLTLPVRMRDAVPIEGRPTRRTTVADRTVRQFEAGHLRRDVLVPCFRPDTLAVLGVTAEDMYSDDLDWDSLSNQTATCHGSAVCSLARLFPEFHHAAATAEAERHGMDLAMRMFADAAGGMLGATPCRKYYCVMNQARYTSMKEPLHLCPNCLRRLRWSLGFDVVERYKALRRYYCRIERMDEARWILERLKECVPAAEAAEAEPGTAASALGDSSPAGEARPAIVTFRAPASAAAAPATPENLYRAPVNVEADPPGFYAGRGWRERGLARRAGGFDADARDWILPFQKYVASEPLRPTRGRHTLLILPLGPQDEAMRRRLERIRDFLAVYFTLPVRTLPPVPLVGRPSRPATVAGRTVRQYEAEALVEDVLRPRRSSGALVVVGLATQDLYSAEEDWPSVAHLSRRSEGLAVVSLARTFPAFFRKESRPDGPSRDVRLALGMAADATARAIGLTPCRKYYCVMNQARRASTREPLHLCPDCLRKLRWTLGFDLVDRYEALGRFYEETGLPLEATWVRRRMGECRKALTEAAASPERSPP